LGVGKGSQQICGTLGRRPLEIGGVATPRNTLLPTCVIIPNFIVLGETAWA